MPAGDSFDALITRLKKGEQGAATEIWNRFMNRLMALARSRLSDRLRAKVDPEDVTLSAFKSFFRRQADTPFTLDCWDDLWQVLALITLRKCGHQVEHFQTARRNINRELPPPSPEDSGLAYELIARDPTPSEAAMLTETMEQVMQRLKDRERPILILSLQGFTASEISAKTGRSERTVYRVLERVKQELESQNAHDAGRP
jgi:RNA polymerase sigma-70 factor (ECF subfamily)